MSLDILNKNCSKCLIGNLKRALCKCVYACFQTSEALKEAMDPQLLLIRHEQDQTHRGPTHPWVSADSQLADNFIKEQMDGVVVQFGNKTSADFREINVCLRV